VSTHLLPYCPLRIDIAPECLRISVGRTAVIDAYSFSKRCHLEFAVGSPEEDSAPGECADAMNGPSGLWLLKWDKKPAKVVQSGGSEEGKVECRLPGYRARSAKCITA
jgi:hypothetical protein